ncbi:AMP-binding protein [Kroppenstedtia eburnea]|uniref:AMP-binding protein n=1 Tax=Kroppenstedtia eburnea TaxID=714067 RepID=UPI003645DBB7
MADLLHVTMGDLLDEVVSRQGDREGVVYPEKNLRWSYRRFREECNRAAKGLMKLGLKKGDHLAIWATNHPEWLVTQFATGKMGAVMITVNTNYRTRELEYLLRQSDTETLILMEEFKGVSYVEMLYEICPELADSEPGQLCSERLPKLKNVIFLGEERQPGMFLWSDLLQMGDHLDDTVLAERQASLHPDDVINMQYTSGTTGFPKGVMLTHNNIINNGRNIAECMKLTPEDRMCIPVPFFHCFGCVLGILACVNAGSTMVPVIQFDPLTVLRTVEAERCTALHGVPTMFIAELNHPQFSSFDLSSLRTGIMAGSNCPMEVMKRVMNDMGASEITIAYGQTESSPVIGQTRTDDPIERRVSTVGKKLPHVEVKIIDPATGEEVETGEQGELCTRGYHVMKGYYRMPEATRQAIDEEGWLHTGDLATLDEEGYLRITGRLKDMIIRGGENIYPREIEEFLYTRPKILDVQIVGVPDEKYGEEVMAFIRPKEGESLTIDEIREYCIGKIARYKIPRYMHLVDAYPMTASGKIQKFKLREQAIQVLGLEVKS